MSSQGYLLDSHVLIWSLYQPDKLSPVYRSALMDGSRTWISVATVWEVEIKKKVGKLPLPEAIWDQAAEVGHHFLSIESGHALLAASLPLLHGDPFDRMLVAQARIEGLTLLTVDRSIQAYDVAVL